MVKCFDDWLVLTPSEILKEVKEEFDYLDKDDQMELYNKLNYYAIVFAENPRLLDKLSYQFHYDVKKILSQPKYAPIVS